jgi:hypothetical protein
MVDKYGEVGLSRIQGVFIDLKNNGLVIYEKQWSPWDFGPLESRCLRKLVLNLGGWLNWSKSVELVLGFQKLKLLGLFDPVDAGILKIKENKIKLALGMVEKEDAKRSMRKGARYVAPHTKHGSLSKIPNPPGVWLTYKPPRRLRPANLPSNNLDYTLPRDEHISIDSIGNISAAKKRKRPAAFSTQRKYIRLDGQSTESLAQRQEAFAAIRSSRNGLRTDSSPSSSPESSFPPRPESPRVSLLPHFVGIRNSQEV